MHRDERYKIFNFFTKTNVNLFTSNFDHLIYLQSMWASDSSIALAMSRLQLQTPIHHHHFFNHSKNHMMLYRLNNQHQHHARCHLHNKNQTNINSDSNNNNSNNIKQINNIGQNQQTCIVRPQMQTLKNLPATPMTITKHIPTESYVDSDNYLYI